MHVFVGDLLATLIDAEYQPTQNVRRYDCMQLNYQITESRAIVYDANRISQPDACLFDPGYWSSKGAVVGTATGRGAALMLETSFGPAVLRQYHRGGFAAKVSRNRYLFLGYSRSRPLAEAEILSELSTQGLPVPQVLGAICLRHRWTYSGALLTERIADVSTLADLLPVADQSSLWIAVGQCLRRFHQAGIFHADLNARNILVDTGGKVWVIDFDRARKVAPNARQLEKNLQRLFRSLRKLGRLSNTELHSGWSSLISGYQNVS